MNWTIKQRKIQIKEAQNKCDKLTTAKQLLFQNHCLDTIQQTIPRAHVLLSKIQNYRASQYLIHQSLDMFYSHLLSSSSLSSGWNISYWAQHKAQSGFAPDTEHKSVPGPRVCKSSSFPPPTGQKVNMTSGWLSATLHFKLPFYYISHWWSS